MRWNLTIYIFTVTFFTLVFQYYGKGRKSGSQKGSGSGSYEIFWLNKVEAEAEAVPKIWKRKRKQIFFKKNFGSGSGSEFFLKKILEAEAEANFFFFNRKRKRKRSQNQPLPKHCL